MIIRNPLIRRLKRHASVSTIFRMEEPGAEAKLPGNEMSQTNQATPQTPVAVLLPEPIISSLPVGRVIGHPLPPQEHVSAPIMPEPYIYTPPAPDPQVQRSTAIRQAEQSPRPVRREDAPSASLESEWPRLTTIMDRHRERMLTEAEAEAAVGDETAGEPSGEMAGSEVPIPSETPGEPQPKAVTAAAAVQRSAKEPEKVTTRPPASNTKRRRATITEIPTPSKAPVQMQQEVGETEVPLEEMEAGQEEPRALIEPDEVAESEEVLFEPQPEDPLSEKPVDEGAVLPKMPRVQAQPPPGVATIQRAMVHDKKPEAEHEARTDPQTSDETLVSAPQEQSAATDIMEEVETDEIEEPGTLIYSDTTQVAPKRNESHEPVVGVEPRVDQPERPLKRERPATREPLRQQAAPLQSVWPVQRYEAPSPAESPTIVSEPEFAPVFEETVDDQEIQRVLQDVAVGQPTDSSVELITPHRPRPVAPAKPETSKTEIKTKPVSRARRDTFSEPSVPVTEASESGTATIVQRSAAPEEVETEIGTLPGDLWQLINQEVPKQIEQPSPATTISTEEKKLGKKPKAISMPMEPVSRPAALQAGGPAISESAVIQREIIQESTAEDEVASEDTSENGGSEAEEVDTDELARKVYTQIRRRLAVEWERFRQRF